MCGLPRHTMRCDAEYLKVVLTPQIKGSVLQGSHPLQMPVVRSGSQGPPLLLHNLPSNQGIPGLRFVPHILSRASQVTPVVKCNAGDVRGAGFIAGPGRCPGGGHGNPLQCSCLENPMDRGAWWATVHGVKKSWTRLK